MKATTNKRIVLATDLDGTLIPLQGEEGQFKANQDSLSWIRQKRELHQLGLVFVTGRPFDSVEQAILEYNLPKPDWIICDVGSSLLGLDKHGCFHPESQFHQTLAEIVGDYSIQILESQLSANVALEKQESEHQTAHKLSYYTAANPLNELTQQLQAQLLKWQAPYSIVSSVDPFSDRGMVDFLPEGVSKAYALNWWAKFTSQDHASIIFAGDSGNDYAAMVAGFSTIVVGNADRSLAVDVYQKHQAIDQGNRLYLAKRSATCGVIEGFNWLVSGDLQDKKTEPVDWDSVPFGATPISRNTVAFKVWAPKCKRMEIVVFSEQGCESKIVSMQREVSVGKTGIFTAIIDDISAGFLYQYRLNGEHKRPDPRSSWQPEGVDGPSQIINQQAFPWTDQDWHGIAKNKLIIYELHVGTMTQAGTYLALIDQLDSLIELGVTAIELLPLAQTPGRWNWGYDGVHLYAPMAEYGSPNQLKQLIDACHAKGLAVLLDVVYNHLGPEGNYLSEYGPYFSAKHHTPWGDAFNFDDRDNAQVRRFIVDNALYWLREFHFDGLRLDAIHFMYDDSERSITKQISQEVQAYAQRADRLLHLIAESNVYDEQLLIDGPTPAYSALWADCLMHSVYSHGVPGLSLAHRPYNGARDVAEALQHGFLYSGPPILRCERQTADASLSVDGGSPSLESLVVALQTHDSVGNHAHGKRIHQLTDREFHLAAAALFILYPAIPMLFMGEERSATSPFRFFADFQNQSLRRNVDRGRRREYPQGEWKGAIAPSDPQAFFDSKVPPLQECDPLTFSWYQRLIDLRKVGQQTGWLQPKTLQTSYDADEHVFQLSYTLADQQIVVRSQLLNAGHVDVAAVGTALLTSAQSGLANCELLLDSWQFGRPVNAVSSQAQPTGGRSRCLIFKRSKS